MSLVFHSKQVTFRQHLSRRALCFLWVFGFAAGVVAHCIVWPFLSPWMRGIHQESVSIVGLFSVTLLPFLFSAFAVYIGQHWLLYPVCFLKAFCVSLVSFGIWTTFSSAGWLAWILIMFSDFISLPIIFGYSMRHISRYSTFSASEFLFTTSLLCLVGSVDYCWISPFLANLSF